SAATVELLQRLSGATGLDLPASAAYDHPTPADLARHLAALALARPVPEQPAEQSPVVAGRARAEPAAGRAGGPLDEFHPGGLG
ncbi:hypothetical protein VM98_35955, partial [Streptomyces rubellomurinus subsp. indigoferus]